jgi:glycosyltransferase involved in cell wall biosynthesis
MNNDQTISIVLPAHNEEASIEALVRGLLKLFPGQEIIVVNDGSSDATALAASRARAIVLSHEQRRGYGAAIKTGLRAAHGEYILICDGDGQHSPEDAALLAL